MNTHTIPLEDEIRQAYSCYKCMCESLYCVSLPRGAVYSSVICNCGIF